MQTSISTRSKSSLTAPKDNKCINKPHVFHLITYNILSSLNCTSAQYPKCRAEYLDQQGRIEKILGRLKALMMKQTQIICLQEVDNILVNIFVDFFGKYEYHVVSAPSSASFGIMIAYPIHAFKNKSTHIGIVSDFIPEPVKTPSPPTMKIVSPSTSPEAISLLRVSSSSSSIAQKSTYSSSDENLPDTPPVHNDANLPWFNAVPPSFPYVQAKKKRNTAILVNLLHKSTQNLISITNYHMPCAYKTPAVITLHASALSRMVDSYSITPNAIIAGDFNFTPATSTYQMVTTGMLPKEAEDEILAMHHSSKPLTSDHIRMSSPWCSFLKYVRGSEPACTYHAYTEFTQDVFTDTLDYVFFRQESMLKPLFSRFRTPQSLRKMMNSEPSLPSLHEPSDHVMLHACFGFG